MTDLVFSRVALEPNNDLDVLMGYQILLGRDPESSFVIREAKRNSTRNFLLGTMQSPEFRSGVADALRANRPLPHEAFGPSPAEAQRAWLAEQLDLEPEEAAALAGAKTWRAFLLTFLHLSGDADTPPPPTEETPTDDTETAAFTLINMDAPRPNAPLPPPGATLAGNGWLITPGEITELRVLLDGTVLTIARTGLPRPDVAKRYPHYRHVDSCGWAFSARVPPELESARTLEVVAFGPDGEWGRKALMLTASAGAAEAAAPEVVVDDPAFPPICLAIDRADAFEGTVHARGWAVSRTPMARLEILIGQQKLGEAELGGERPDVAREQREYPNAARSGWSFSGPVPSELAPGPAALRVEAYTEAGERRSASWPITIPVEGAAPAGAVPRSAADEAIVRLEIDVPALAGNQALAPVRGAFTISGWAVSPAGIEYVDISSSGRPLGRASLGMRREDIGAAFPDYEGSLRGGYALVLPAGRVEPGHHEILVEARGRNGASAERRFSIEVAVSENASDRLRTHVPPAEAALSRRLFAAVGRTPAIAVATVVGRERDAAAHLDATLASLRNQNYDAWSVVLAGPAVTPGPVAKSLRGRIFRTLPERAEYLLPVRAGDIFGADALAEFAAEAALHPGATLIYADEIAVDPALGRDAPRRKPDWSPTYQLASNYIGRPFMAPLVRCREARVSPETIVRNGFADAVFRLTDKPSAVVRHLPLLLLRRSDPVADPRTARALSATLARRRIAAEVEPVPHAPSVFRVRAPDTVRTPLVSIVMPTCGGRGLVYKCVTSIRDVTAYKNYEFVVLDNVPMSDRRTKRWLRKQCETVLDVPKKFNWSRFNNLGARRARGEMLLFLNDDMEARDPYWLHALLEHAEKPEVGITGAKLLYPDGRVQHAGQFLSGTHARHAFRFAEANDPGPFGLAAAAREVTAVTGACMAVRTEVWKEVGGFDEAHSVVNNDLDFCLRVRELGLSVIYTPHALLIHHELASREKMEDVFDEDRFLGRWRHVLLAGDPFLNPRLLSDGDHFVPDSEPPRRVVVGPPGPPKHAIRKILVTKLDHLGDWITGTAALRSCRERFPEAELHVLVPTGSVALARAEQGIDAVHVFDFFHVRSGEGKRALDEEAYAALAERLAPEQYDIAIDLRLQGDTREVLRHTGARLLAGYDHRNKHPFLHIALEWEGDIELAPKRAHVSERLRQLVAAVDEACRPLPVSPLHPAADPLSVPALAALPRAFRARPLVVIHPGVGNVVRQWPQRHYSALVDLLVRELGVSVALIGAPEEEAIAAAVLDGVDAKDWVASLVGRVRLSELPDLFRAAALFVGNNSGPQHIAAAAGAPTIGIHSGVVDAREWAPAGPGAIAVRREMGCSPCYLEFASDCPRGLACLTGLRPSDVFALCRRMIALRPAPALAARAARRRPGRRQESPAAAAPGRIREPSLSA